MWLEYAFFAKEIKDLLYGFNPPSALSLIKEIAYMIVLVNPNNPSSAEIA